MESTHIARYCFLMLVFLATMIQATTLGVYITPPFPTMFDSLTCHASLITPGANTTVRWYINGSLNQTRYISASAGGNLTDSFSFVNINTGDTVMCRATQGSNNGNMSVTVVANSMSIDPSIAGPTWISDSMTTFIGGQMKDIIAGVFCLAIVSMTLAGLGWSTVALAYGILCFILFATGFSALFIPLAVLSIIVGSVMKLMGV